MSIRKLGHSVTSEVLPHINLGHRQHQTLPRTPHLIPTFGHHRLVLLADANSTLSSKTMRPVSTKVDVRLGHSTMAKQQPEAKYRLRKEVENGVNHDFGIDARLAGTIGDSPNTAQEVWLALSRKQREERSTYMGYAVHNNNVNKASPVNSLETPRPFALTVLPP